tara:strand:- start:669 stop:1484 length:816 start_codon:yes stop_codon:yes gene_type:complete
LKQTRNFDFTPYLKISPANIKTVSDLRAFGKESQLVNQGYELLACNQWEEKLLNPKTDWKYYINEFGFRNDWNLNSKKETIGFFGCSFTFGEGIHNDDMFVSIVSKALDMNPINIGVGGAGLERTVRTFASASNVIKFDYAVLTLPAWTRQMHVTNEGELINIIPYYPHNGFEKLSAIYSSFDEDFFVNQAILYVNWIGDIAKANNIKLILCSWDDPLNELCKFIFPKDTIEPFPDIDDKCARDKMHPGPKSQAAHAEQIIKAIQDRQRQK